MNFFGVITTIFLLGLWNLKSIAHYFGNKPSSGWLFLNSSIILFKPFKKNYHPIPWTKNFINRNRIFIDSKWLLTKLMMHWSKLLGNYNKNKVLNIFTPIIIYYISILDNLWYLKLTLRKIFKWKQQTRCLSRF